MMPRIYDEYFEKFIPKLRRRIDEFSGKLQIPDHGPGRAYLGYITGIGNVKFYTEYTPRGYGGEYKGFIVGVYIDGDNYVSRYNYLLSKKSLIENQLNIHLHWIDTGRAGRIFVRLDEDIDNRENWPDIIDFQINNLVEIVKVFKPYIRELRNINNTAIVHDGESSGDEMTKEDVLETIRNYEQSDFEDTRARNRFFTIDESEYILPIKFIVDQTSIRISLDTSFTTDEAEAKLKRLFDNYHGIDIQYENATLPLYQEIAKKVLEYRDNHQGLIDILSDMKESGINTISLTDQDNEGEITLSDIDPFTFYANFNRRIRAKNRAKILKYLKDDWELKEKIPTFDPRIPWMQNQSAWFFAWENNRNEDDIAFLWKLFVEILNERIEEPTFNRCLQIRRVDNNLSFGLYWLNSNDYIALDSATKDFIRQYIHWYQGENLSVLKYKNYFRLIRDLKSNFPNKSFYEIVAARGNGVDETGPEVPGPQSKQIKNIILYGPPGTGKTHNTIYLIDMIENNESDHTIFETIRSNEPYRRSDLSQIQERIAFVTFHQSFGYEDFIEGFRPDESGIIQLQDGIFKTICSKAENNKDQNYYLVIDEINRGNISKIFGELITLIEEDKRDGYEVKLPYSKKKFSIPSNLYIISTMNSTDKSIALIDIALRRRFVFLKMEPNPELIGDSRTKELFVLLNKKIEEKLGKEYLIGHSYFMNITNERDLSFVLEYKIKPLLEEYFYGDAEGYSEIEAIITGE